MNTSPCGLLDGMSLRVSELSVRGGVFKGTSYTLHDEHTLIVVRVHKPIPPPSIVVVAVVAQY